MFQRSHIWNYCHISHGLTHWGRVTHICVVKLTIIGWDNGLSPGRRQAIIWTNAGILLIGPLGTNFTEILIGIQTFSFKKMHLKMSSAKWRPFSPGLNVLNNNWLDGTVHLHVHLHIKNLKSSDMIPQTWCITTIANPLIPLWVKFLMRQTDVQKRQTDKHMDGWFEMPLLPLWCHCNESVLFAAMTWHWSYFLQDSLSKWNIHYKIKQCSLT